MYVRRRDDAPRNERGGQVSRLLFAPQLGSTRLAVTWVRGEPGSQQGLHAHDHSEQIYVVVRGRGLMIVDDEALEIEAGSAVLIRAGAKHAIRNCHRRHGARRPRAKSGQRGSPCGARTMPHSVRGAEATASVTSPLGGAGRRTRSRAARTPPVAPRVRRRAWTRGSPTASWVRGRP